MKMPAGFNDYLNTDNILGQIYKNCKLKITSWTVGRCVSAAQSMPKPIKAITPLLTMALSNLSFYWLLVYPIYNTSYDNMITFL